jgi:hypothetical protein
LLFHDVKIYCSEVFKDKEKIQWNYGFGLLKIFDKTKWNTVFLFSHLLQKNEWYFLQINHLLWSIDYCEMILLGHSPFSWYQFSPFSDFIMPFLNMKCQIKFSFATSYSLIFEKHNWRNNVLLIKMEKILMEVMFLTYYESNNVLILWRSNFIDIRYLWVWLFLEIVFSSVGLDNSKTWFLELKIIKQIGKYFLILIFDVFIIPSF